MTATNLLKSQLEVISKLKSSIVESRVAILTGKKYSGKSTILLSLLESLSDYNQCYLPAPMHLSSFELKSKLCNQLFGEMDINPRDSLYTIFSNLDIKFSSNILIVIDCADRLKINYIIDLLSLIKISDISLNIVFAVDEDKCDSFCKNITKTYFSKFDVFEVPDLVLEEGRTLYMSLLYLANVERNIPDSVINKYLLNSVKNPTDVIELVQRVIHKPYSLENSKGKLTLLLTASAFSVFLVLFSVKFYLDYEDNTLSKIKITKASDQQKSLINKDKNARHLLHDDAEQKDDDSQVAIADLNSIDSSNQFKLNTVDKKSKLIFYNKKKQLKVDPATNLLVRTEEAETEESADLNKNANTKIVNQKQLTTKSSNRELKNQETTKISLKSNTGYIIQIASFAEIDRMILFKKNTNLDPKLLTYIKNKDKYLVVFGSYDSRELALIEANKTFSDGGFWVRSWKGLDVNSSIIQLD